ASSKLRGPIREWVQSLESFGVEISADQERLKRPRAIGSDTQKPALRMRARWIGRRGCRSCGHRLRSTWFSRHARAGKVEGHRNRFAVGAPRQRRERTRRVCNGRGLDAVGAQGAVEM